MPRTQGPVRITLKSTSEVEMTPPPARVWRGRSAGGAQIVAFISILSIDPRLRRALETRIASEAVITIPVKEGP